MSPEQRGLAIPDTENAYRVITCAEWWSEERKRPSSAAFDYPKFSVEIVSRTTPAESAARFRDIKWLAEFNCGTARPLGFDTRDERDDIAPDNLAHAHVYFDEYPVLKKGKRKARARNLAESCRPVAV